MFFRVRKKKFLIITVRGFYHSIIVSFVIIYHFFQLLLDSVEVLVLYLINIS